jgi:nucleotide-binding universal stress UspA family protein
MVPRILIGYDGSPGAIAAVNQVAGRSWARGTKVRIVTATASTIPAESKSGIGRLAEKAAARFTELGMDAEAVARKGDARKVLLAEAKAFEADCIFIGSKGGSGVTRFLLGSVSSAVAAHSPCSVEVVRKSRRSKA